MHDRASMKLREHETFSAIDGQTFTSVLGRCSPGSIAPEPNTLDNERYEKIPDFLQQQPNESKFLSKGQVATLVDWKLSHGKFRPTLKPLFQRNADDVVEKTTADAFRQYTSGDNSKVKQSLGTLTKLVGIGPATASLILSVYDPAGVPFFSDELYRWTFYEDAKGKGWDREIKYTVKEYMTLFEQVQWWRTQADKVGNKTPMAVEMEKVAYILGTRRLNDAEEAQTNAMAEKQREQLLRPPKDAIEDQSNAAEDEMTDPVAVKRGSKRKLAEDVDQATTKTSNTTAKHQSESATKARRSKRVTK